MVLYFFSTSSFTPLRFFIGTNKKKDENAKMPRDIENSRLKPRSIAAENEDSAAWVIDIKNESPKRIRLEYLL